MKPFHRACLILLALALPCAAQTVPVRSEIGYEGGNSTNRVVITWEAIPGKLYNVLTTTALGQQPWQALNPIALYASNNLVRFRNTNNLPIRFYKVVKLDTDPPEVWRFTPGSNATAVSRQSLLKAYLRDESAIDPASIVLTVGTNPPATLADARLAYTNGTLTYTPATNQFLGTNGQMVTNRLIVADTLGHSTTNTWPFKLELTPILASNVIIISPSSPLALVSTNGDTFVFSYTGASSGLTNGHILVSTDSNFPYKRLVLSVTDSPGAHTVSLVTTQAALADILLQGSVHFVGGEFVPDAEGFTKAADTDGITINLGGKTLYDANNVTVQTVSGRLFFDPDFSVSAELRSPRTFDLDVSASLAFDLTLQASWQNTWTFSGEQRVGKPLRQFRLLGFIPTPIPIPIFAEAVWEFYVGTEGEVTAEASITAGFESTADLAFGARLRDGQWTNYGRENIVVMPPPPVAWQGGGSGRIRGYVEPRLTVYLESLVGPTANVRPYLEIEGNACVQPGRAGVDVALYRGINGTLAVDVRGWDEDWWNLPAWEVFNIRSVKPIWHENLSTPVGQPPQTFGNMVWIPCGSFTMGSPETEPGRGSQESPQTRVTISQGFWMGQYEVTQAEYLAVRGSNPSYFTGNSNRPVEQVSWHDALAYCAVLTSRERSAGRLPAGYAYRLPTEAEWEYACRAGTTTPFYNGKELQSGMANFDGTHEYLVGHPDHYNTNGIYFGMTTAVGSYAPNAWGLYDMHGNVWEWCSNWWSSSLPGGSVTDPQGPATGSLRVRRGGSFDYRGFRCRSADRYYSNAPDYCSCTGFRVVLAPSQ
jgi:formylglycine-generating enzyme required for sulfatase activity